MRVPKRNPDYFADAGKMGANRVFARLFAPVVKDSLTTHLPPGAAVMTV
jgi:hypothetical protein